MFPPWCRGTNQGWGTTPAVLVGSWGNRGGTVFKLGKDGSNYSLEIGFHAFFQDKKDANYGAFRCRKVPFWRTEGPRDYGRLTIPQGEHRQKMANSE
jgi:hypothetical protein